MDIKITFDALPKQANRFERFANTIRDLTPFWREAMAPRVLADVQENFDRQGALVGGWPALSPAYAAWKAQRWGSHLGILELSLKLRGSLQWMGSKSGGDIGPAGFFSAGMSSMVVGTTVPYAAKHQFGTGGMPRRQMLFARDPDAYAPIWKEWVMARWDATRGEM